MKVTPDPGKRNATLKDRGLDFADAAQVFDSKHAVIEDARRDYGEKRYISACYLQDRIVVIAWTPRAEARHVFSMRWCHEEEAADWRKLLD